MKRRMYRPLILLPSMLLAVVGCRLGPHSAPSPAPRAECIEEYWPNGKLRLRREIVRNAAGEAIDNGLWTEWYDDGRKSYEAHYDHGQKNGLVTRWHRNGRKHMEQHFLHGLRDGISRTWDQEGRLRKEEQHLAGPAARHVDGCGGATAKVRHQQHFDHGQAVP